MHFKEIHTKDPKNTSVILKVFFDLYLKALKMICHSRSLVKFKQIGDMGTIHVNKRSDFHAFSEAQDALLAQHSQIMLGKHRSSGFAQTCAVRTQ